eukprot:2002970-Amphidinium_carterae.1
MPSGNQSIGQPLVEDAESDGVCSMPVRHGNIVLLPPCLTECLSRSSWPCSAKRLLALSHGIFGMLKHTHRAIEQCGGQMWGGSESKVVHRQRSSVEVSLSFARLRFRGLL